MTTEDSNNHFLHTYIRREHTIVQSVPYEPQRGLHEETKYGTLYLLRGQGISPPEDDIRIYRPLPEKQRLGTFSTA